MTTSGRVGHPRDVLFKDAEMTNLPDGLAGDGRWRLVHRISQAWQHHTHDRHNSRNESGK